MLCSLFIDKNHKITLDRDLHNIRPMHQLFIVSYHGRRKSIQIYHNRIYFINQAFLLSGTVRKED